MKTIIVFFGILLLSVFSVSANGDHQKSFEEGNRLVETGIGCDKLNDEQFEAIGEYYMEQMHPGKSHEMMDNMMGGEGSESLKQMHITMAKRLYCNEDVGGMMGNGAGMMMPMGMMMNMMSGGMMGSNMMGNLGGGMMGNSLGNYPLSRYAPWWTIIWYIFWIAVIAVLIWFIYNFIIKKERDDSALQILKKRYIKGEITKKKFEEMKKDIGE